MLLILITILAIILIVRYVWRKSQDNEEVMFTLFYCLMTSCFIVPGLSWLIGLTFKPSSSIEVIDIVKAANDNNGTQKLINKNESQYDGLYWTFYVEQDNGFVEKLETFSDPVIIYEEDRQEPIVLVKSHNCSNLIYIKFSCKKDEYVFKFPKAER